MRLKAIQLSWFRGAAEGATLEPQGKSLVMYGGNGSGKSSFVDAVEFIIRAGRVGHLAHEYSGKSLEKAIPNTHMPDGKSAVATVELCDTTVAQGVLTSAGSLQFTGSALSEVQAWDYRQTILRQDELADFVRETKGEKYSTLLPLLGLRPREIAAENLRRLSLTISSEASPWALRARIDAARKESLARFGSKTDGEIADLVQDLHKQYCATNLPPGSGLQQCDEVRIEIGNRVTKLTRDSQSHLTLTSAGSVDLTSLVARVRAANLKLADATEPLVAEKLAILESVNRLAERIGTSDLECPACGHEIAAADFKAHVVAETKRLHEFRAAFDDRNAARAALSDAVKALRNSILKPEAEDWRRQQAEGTLAAELSELKEYDAEVLRTTCGEKELAAITDRFAPLALAALAAAGDAPVDAVQLAADRESCRTAALVFEAIEFELRAEQSERLIRVVQSLESAIRDGIRQQAQKTIAEITQDVQAFWAVLHPGVPIQDVRLYVPVGTEKAIDIGLKFYEKELTSPRLTLSEGYRNSLGLCIFLAMAKGHGGGDQPIILDDVIVSFDRDHRGMVAQLLATHFKERQVIILTHDRDWAGELRHQLDNAAWKFETLLAFETPAVGIRVSDKKTTFAEALSVVDVRPDSAANDARKIMDLELSMICERLRIRLPYLRGTRNDHRMAHDFLERIASDGQSCFEVLESGKYGPHVAAVEVLKSADSMLMSWGNKGSHSFDVVKSEARNLIAHCEAAVEVFRCSSCQKPVWFADAGGPEAVQCQCGVIRWRYGKG